MKAPRVVTLHPGDVALGLRGDRLETLLGSCVAIVLTDPRRMVGAMCHFVYTRTSTHAAAASAAQADRALQAMAQLLQTHGIRVPLCEAYVVGGGNMFPGIVSSTSVGDVNAQWALGTLAVQGVRVVSADVGGAVYRRLRWTVGPQAPQIEAVPL